VDATRKEVGRMGYVNSFTFFCHAEANPRCGLSQSVLTFILANDLPSQIDGVHLLQLHSSLDVRVFRDV
jgi:hypothetical protein